MTKASAPIVSPSPLFVWIAEGSGPETLASGVGGNHHNPYVEPSVVKALVALAQDGS